MAYFRSNLTAAQRRDFERIAMGQRPLGGYKVIQKLIDRGLIEEGDQETIGKDQFGLIKVRCWFVPMPIHIQWCEWCSKHVRDPQ